MDERLIFHGVVNRVERILDREDKTGGKLLKASTGVHQCGRIGKKVEPCHAFITALRRLGQPAAAG